MLWLLNLCQRPTNGISMIFNCALKIKYILVSILALLLISGCSLFDDDHPNITGPVSCSAEDYNQYVYNTMKRYYYWYDEVDPFNQIDPQDTIAYPTPQSLIDVLKYSTLDRFSGVSNATTYEQFYGDGIFLGTGLRLLTDETTDNVIVAYSFVNSDANTQGIVRGDRLVEINGYAANGLTGVDWENAWGTREVGNEVLLLIEKQNGTQTPVTVTKSLITINSTQNSTVIDTGLKKIAYLHFTNFLGPTGINDLNSTFENFINNNVEELIVDLRYNGGGSVATARHLGSLIGGQNTSSSLFAKLIFNDKRDGYNSLTESHFFYSQYNALNLSRVIFITTDSSCSASELVINSLIPNPNIDVVVVGSTSCGKPVGSVLQTHCDKSLAVINFEIKNEDNQGQYFDGISAGYNGLTAFCDATDDVSLPLGNTNESSVSSALDYINNNQCNVQKTRSTTKFKPLNQFTDLNNLY